MCCPPLKDTQSGWILPPAIPYLFPLSVRGGQMVVCLISPSLCLRDAGVQVGFVTPSLCLFVGRLSPVLQLRTCFVSSSSDVLCVEIIKMCICQVMAEGFFFLLLHKLFNLPLVCGEENVGLSLM